MNAAPIVINESPMTTAALRCVALGWYVFPLVERGKEPDSQFAPHGFQSASNDPNVVREWWTKKPLANVGVDLGRSNLTVLDFDHGKPPQELGLPSTLQVSTSRGVHCYFSGTAKQGDMYWDGVHVGEIKSQGGYVLGPNSVHPSGPVYNIVLRAPVAPLPQGLVERLRPIKAPIDASVNGAKIPYGQHDNTLRDIARKLRGMGLEEEAIYNILVEIVEKRCEGYGSDYLDMCRKHAKTVVDKFEPNPVGTQIALNQQPDKAATTATKVEPVKPIVVVKGDNFMAEAIAPRKVLVRSISTGEPVIFEQSINQVFAWRGIGKTCLGLGFVRCLATAGRFLNFQCDERVPVLYVEGELPDSQFQERWRAIVGKTNGYAYMSSIDKQPEHSFTSLASEAGMAKIEATLTDLEASGVKIKVLFLDNISTLFNVAANDEEVWIGIQSWFTKLRSRGITVFFFHHAGKAGASRSHSKSEDMLDVSIKLEAPEDPESGHLHALMTFDKARAGISERPAEIKLHRTHSNDCVCALGMSGFCPGDGVRWEFIPKADKRGEAEALFSQGRSISETAQDLDVPLGTARRWRTEWTKKGKKTVLTMSGAA